MFYVSSNGDTLRIKTVKDFADVPASEREKYEECHVFLKPLSWGRSCELQSQAMTSDPMTLQRVFDADMYVRRKLMTVIGKWSFVDKNEAGLEIPVPVNESTVDNLHPAVADLILKEYSKRFELSEQDRKNS
jgi:hypothetical protein